MRKARSRQQADLDDTIHDYASSPRTKEASDPRPFDNWSKEDVLHFLKQLLESECIGVTAYAAIGRAADSQIADLALESELAQGAICVLLKKEITARGGADILRGKKTTAIPSGDCNLGRLIGSASRNQARLADMIEDAVLSIFDSKLNAKLVYLLLLHRKQVELLEAFVT